MVVVLVRAGWVSVVGGKGDGLRERSRRHFRQHDNGGSGGRSICGARIGQLFGKSGSAVDWNREG